MVGPAATFWFYACCLANHRHSRSRDFGKQAAFGKKKKASCVSCCMPSAHQSQYQALILKHTPMCWSCHILLRHGKLQVQKMSPVEPLPMVVFSLCVKDDPGHVRR
ncbi:hypothetical protein ABW19_dt0207812 [Dactylella cylindrospora]|nr:hypothetical protein ABW19_dt0207812 [Dactylella cylindrospora]